MEADLAGFKEAQDTLIDQMGSDVIFYGPLTVAWPEGTPLDPETEAPFDPTLEPAATSAASSAVVRCGIVRGRTRPADDALATAIGDLDDEDAVLLVPIDDASEVADATEVELFGTRYSITERKPDGVGGVIQRVLTYVRRN